MVNSTLEAVQIDAADITTIVAYFVLVMGIGIYSIFSVKSGTEEGYFLAGRYMTWLPVGASLFATNIGSEHYVGLSGSGAEAGIGVAAFELNALLIIPLLAWVFVPVFMASGVGTLPEYMNKRYGGQRIRIVLSLISMVLYIFTKNSVDMYSGALFIQQAIGWDIYVSVFVLLSMTVLSTVAGGLAAVIYTDTLQCFIMIIGGMLLFVLGILEVGGWESLYHKYIRSMSDDVREGLMAGTWNTTRGLPHYDSWTMLRDPLDREMPWAGFIFGQTTSSIWYWCCDQMMVQRVIAARNVSHAQGGTLFCGLLKLLPIFTMILPGMISRVLYPNDVACATAEACMAVCENESGCSNIAYPKLVLGLMPSGLRGFMIAMMLSATMSDLSSTFNSASTLFTMDIYKNFRKKASNKELMIVGRLAVIVVVGIGVGTIPLVTSSSGSQLFTYIQEITNYFSPPIAAVYIVAILWKRSNEKGTFWSLLIGFLVGTVKMILLFVFPEPSRGEEDSRNGFIKLHYMYFAIVLFFLVVIVNVVISLLTEASSSDLTVRTLYWTRHSREIRMDDIKYTGKEEIDVHMLERAMEIKKTSDLQDFEGYLPEKSEKSSIVEDENIPWYKKMYQATCGFDNPDPVTSVPNVDEQVANLCQSTDIRQKNSDRMLLFLGFVGLMVFGLFQYIFFTVDLDYSNVPSFFHDIKDKCT